MVFIEDEIKSIFAFFKSGIKLSIFTDMDYSNGKNKDSIEKRTNNYINIIKVIISKIGIYIVIIINLFIFMDMEHS